jgi:hypothetical protein
LHRQLAIVVADYIHDGAHHLTLRAANGSSYLIPGWMAELGAAQIQLTDTPRISISRLLDLRAFLDSALPSASENSPCDGGFYNEAVGSGTARPIRGHSTPDGALNKARALDQLQVLLWEAISTPTSTHSATLDREAQNDEDFT